MRKVQTRALHAGFSFTRRRNHGEYSIRASRTAIDVLERFYSACSPLANSAVPVIDHKNLIVEQSRAPREKPPNEQLVFGKEFSDHMCSMKWDAESNAWTTLVPHKSFWNVFIFYAIMIMLSIYSLPPTFIFSSLGYFFLQGARNCARISLPELRYTVF